MWHLVSLRSRVQHPKAVPGPILDSHLLSCRQGKAMGIRTEAVSPCFELRPSAMRACGLEPGVAASSLPVSPSMCDCLLTAAALSYVLVPL